MPAYIIKKATREDAQTLGHIGVATFIESYTDDIDGPAMSAHCTNEHSKAVYEKYLASAQGACWLAQHAQTHAPIGYALNCTPDASVKPQVGDIELKRIYVLSKFHGGGVARALLEASEAHARAESALRLLLGTYEANHRAVAFYTKHGFKTVGIRKFQVGDKIYDDIIMAKTL